VPFLPRNRIERTRDGSIAVGLPRAERELIASLPRELLGQLDTRPDDPALQRLFPPAYEDGNSEREYQELMADELLAGRRQALATLERTADAKRLDDDEAQAWLTALNDLRLVLGTRLNVTEDLSLATLSPEHPRSREYALYAYLSWLQEQLIQALTAGLST
jgi:Domain of unknown function (DUF2017)